MSSRVSSPILIGRAHEAERLRADYAAAVDGARTVIVGGEAGVGKTRLIDDLIGHVRAAGGPVIAGGCIDMGDHGVPFAPFVDGLRGLTRDLPLAVEAALEAGGTELWRLMPGRSRPSPMIDPAIGRDRDPEGIGQARLFEQVLTLLGQLGGEAPALVVLEDVHWADQSTRDLLRFLVHAMRDERVCVVVTYRTDDLHRRHPLMPVLVDLGRSPRVQQLPVSRLGLDDTRSLIAAIDGGGLARERAEVVFERSEGNPFFVEELIAVGSDDPGGLVPESIRETLTVRIARLPLETQELLRTASVLGRHADHELVRAVASLGDAEVLDRIRPAVEAHIILAEADPPAYTFRHALVGETLYDDLLPAARTALHVRAAEALERRIADGFTPPPSEAEVARHWDLAHRTDRALAASKRAADEADGLAAYADVKAQLERVLALWPSVVEPERLIGMDRATVVERAADASAAIGDFPRAIALGVSLLETIDPHAEPDRVLRLVDRVAWYHWDMGDAVGAEHVVERAAAVQELASPESRVVYFGNLGQVHWSASRFADQAAAMEAALTIAGAGPEVHIERTYARGLHGVAILSMGRVDDGLAELEAAESELHGVGEVRRITATIWLTHAVQVAGWHERGVEVGMAALARLRRNGLERRFGPYLMANVADLLLDLGRWDEVLALIEEVARQRPTSRAVPWVLESIADISSRKGEMERAAASLAEARALITTRDAIADRCWFHRAVGFVAAIDGRLDEARTEFRTTIELSPDPEHDMPMAIWAVKSALSVEADLAAQARSSRRPSNQVGDAWTDRLFAIAEAIVAATAGETAPAMPLFGAHVRAERSRLEGRADPAAWAGVVEAATAAMQPWDAAWGQLREAEARLVADRDRTAARSLLLAARSTALDLGAVPLLTQVDRLASAARIDLSEVTRDEAAGVAVQPAQFGLSAREREVLGLIALGWTNRDIGSALFISDKTASVHVTHILDKLGVSSRVEAALLAQRAGIVADVAEAAAPD